MHDYADFYFYFFKVAKTESKNSANLTDSDNGNNQASCPLIFLAKESAIN